MRLLFKTSTSRLAFVFNLLTSSISPYGLTSKDLRLRLPDSIRKGGWGESSDIALSLSENEEWSVKRLRGKTAVSSTGLCNPACGYAIALAGVVLQSVGQMVGVCLPAALRL